MTLTDLKSNIGSLHKPRLKFPCVYLEDVFELQLDFEKGAPNYT